MSGSPLRVTELYIGLMSGTSLDGVDAVLVDFGPDRAIDLRVVAHVHQAFPADLAGELLALNQPTDNELHRAALAGNALARRYAQCVAEVLARARLAPQQITAIGAHGQTVRHRPGAIDGVGYTLQLNNPALLAELTRIDIVADLRSRDVAAGGQGAPLVPAFHRAVFAREGATVAVLNIGGIGNLTVLRADGVTIGLDCGPGNALMDGWCREHTGRAYDDAGQWAASGRVIDTLLASMLSEPYFAMPPPKSTGRDLFHRGWLDRHLAQGHLAARPQDVQATLAALTAVTCAADTTRHAPDAEVLLVCGGGAFNQHLMLRLAQALPAVAVRSTADRGLPAEQVEACAFAWLARAFVRRDCGNLPGVTGAAGPRVLGALYPAG